MLPRSARLTSPNDFARTTKSGLRSTSPSLVTYLYLTGENTPARAGLIISKSVGGSVVRHSVARKLRAGLSAPLGHLPNGALLVVRALSSKSNINLQAELSEAISLLISRTKVAQ